jgi:hypothetical protein
VKLVYPCEEEHAIQCSTIEMKDYEEHSVVVGETERELLTGCGR